jgi:hypothetical protein
MSRRPQAGGNTGVQLFPFLAVLLCTMGALILLLMLLAQQARSQVAADAKAKTLAKRAEVDNADLERKRDDLQWRIEQLKAARDKTQADVAKHRDRLAHIDEHFQRLRKQLDELTAAEKLLLEKSVNGDIDKAALEAQLADLRAKIAEAKLKLEQARAAGQKPQAFAVVPYEGSNGTRRRPIYIECRADAVVLQPEGIVFPESDFAGSRGPSNPLASCLRVVSEYITRGNNYADGEQPYPLLLVRPSGIGAYYAARGAMESWDSDFGYELVNEDWPLEFPPADPLLSQMLAKTAEEARVRQAMIARAAPALRKSRGATAPTFQMTPGGQGGFDQGNNTGSSGGSGGDAGATLAGGRGARVPNLDAGYSSTRETPTGLAGGGGGTGGGSGGYGAPQLGSTGGQLGGPSGGGQVPMNTPAGGGRSDGPWLGSPIAGGAGGGGQGNGPASGPGGGAENSSATGGGNSPDGTPSTVGPRYAGNSNNPGNSNNAGGTTTGPTSGTFDGSGSPNGSNNQPGYGPLAGSGSSGYGTAPNAAAGNSGGTATSGMPGGGGSSTSGNASPAMSGMASAGGAPSSGGQPAGSGGIGTAPSAAMSGEPQTPSISTQVPAGPGEYVESMARKRGKDWGLPEIAARSTPLTRPIQLYMSADQATLFSDRGIPDKQVQFSGGTEESIDTLVAQVWDHVKGWGIAGRGMYWKPVLSVHVAPDGTARFNEFKQLMAGSGLEVVGKQIAVAAPSGPVRR